MSSSYLIKSKVNKAFYKEISDHSMLPLASKLYKRPLFQFQSALGICPHLRKCHYHGISYLEPMELFKRKMRNRHQTSESTILRSSRQPLNETRNWTVLSCPKLPFQINRTSAFSFEIKVLKSGGVERHTCFCSLLA